MPTREQFDSEDDYLDALYRWWREEHGILGEGSVGPYRPDAGDPEMTREERARRRVKQMAANLRYTAERKRLTEAGRMPAGKAVQR